MTWTVSLCDAPDNLHLASLCFEFCRALDTVEVFYDSDHPDVFIHIQSPGAALNGPAPNSSQVLLLTTTSAVNGYSKAGSLYRGSGYWAQGQDLPQALSDLSVSLPEGPSPLPLTCMCTSQF